MSKAERKQAAPAKAAKEPADGQAAARPEKAAAPATESAPAAKKAAARKRTGKTAGKTAQAEKQPVAKAEKGEKKAKAPHPAAPATLELVKEARLADLLEDALGGRHEASGVHCHDDLLYVVFDNYPNVACLTPELTLPADRPAVLRQRGERIGYEDLTYEPQQQRWYCLIEATEYEPDLFKSRIEEYDETFRFIESLELNFKVKGSNKGIEGLSHLRYKGEDYLLALCEGNACKGGAAGREPGKGRILLFQRGVKRWEHVGTIKLPKAVQFADYSALDLHDRWVAVVSQESSALWVGRLKAEPTGLDDLWEDDGRTYLFPRARKGRPLYCNVEGATWLAEGTLAVVSDRAKQGKQGAECTEKDESIHIFRIPAG